MANYPTSVSSFTTKVNDQVIEPSHPNDLQAEIVALENALLSSGLAHHLKFVDATFDIGQSGASRPRDLWLSRNADIQGTLGVVGVASLATGTGNRVVIGGGAAASELRFLEPSGGGVHFTSIKAQAQAADIPYTLPDTQGVAGSGLQNDGNGVLSWAAAAQTYEVCAGRLTLTTGVPVTSSDVTAATTIYFTPYKGNRIGLHDGSNWNVFTFTERSLALGTLTSGLPYDVFIYDNAGTLTLEFTAWTSDTARATALTLQDGIYVKSGDTTRRYLGTFRTVSTTETEDSAAKRYLWNYYNRVPRALKHAVEGTNTWNYTTATVRQANANAANQVEVVVGVAEVAIHLDLIFSAFNASNIMVQAGIGEDATNAISPNSVGGIIANTATNQGGNSNASFDKLPAIGRHVYSWNEWSTATGTTTWQGDNGSTLGISNGLTGHIEG